MVQLPPAGQKSHIKLVKTRDCLWHINVDGCSDTNTCVQKQLTQSFIALNIRDGFEHCFLKCPTQFDLGK